MKSFKNLFIKEEEEQQDDSKPSFPVTPASPTFVPSNQPTLANSNLAASNPYLAEIIEVYEKGLEGINMPGYDFYDFYLAIKAAGSQDEAIYKMAFQMGKSMDATVTSQKLSTDAEYYISKINDVHQTYQQKGNQKLEVLQSELKNEKEKLTSEAGKMESEITQMKQQIIALEQKLHETRGSLAKADEKYKPQQDVIKQKLSANDQAMQLSIQKLMAIKEGIQKYIK